MYKDKLIKLIIKGVIGMVIGILLVLFTMPDAGLTVLLTIGMFFAGLPYGWQLSGKVVGGLIVVGSAPVMIFAFMLRLFVSILVGWIAYPIALIYTIVKVVKS